LNKNPYQDQSNSAFWSRSVSRNFLAEDLLGSEKGESLFDLNDKVVSAGSCFASNLIPWIEKEGLEYLRTEELPTQFETLPENLGYRNFSAAYGNIYTARHLLQLYEQALGLRKPIEDRWYVDDLVIDPFRPGLAYPAESDAEFDLLKSAHLSAVLKAFHSATVFVFTLGLTEAWVSKLDGSVFPACPGTINGEFDEAKHEFKNFTVAEVTEDLASFISLLRKSNEHVRFIVTVSPVPLVATATDSHVLLASTYSKSVLRVAAQQVAETVADVTYFPAFEIVTGPQAPFEYFETDRRNVSEIAVAEVMKSLLFGLTTNDADTETSISARVKLKDSLGRRISEMSKRISRAECDEVMMDPDIVNSN
jgi:GSCFA family